MADESFSEASPPASIEEAEARSRNLLERIWEIDRRLGDRNMMDLNCDPPRRMKRDKYNEWRQLALRTKSIYDRERAFLKEWIIGEKRARARMRRISLAASPAPADKPLPTRQTVMGKFLNLFRKPADS